MVEGSKPTVIATLQEIVDSEFCTKAEVLPPTPSRSFLRRRKRTNYTSKGLQSDRSQAASHRLDRAVVDGSS